MIGFCTDSNSQLFPDLIERYGVEVVPITVVVDGQEYFEDVDLDADGFYAFFESGRRPAVTTAAPGPGSFAHAYDALAGRGATSILSVHIGTSYSGAVNAANLAARDASVPVRIVDTGATGFGISFCLREAAEAAARGATLDETAGIAESVSSRLGAVFVAGLLDLALGGGRVRAGREPEDAAAVPVFASVQGAYQPIGEVASFDAALDAIVNHVRSQGGGLRVAVARADAASEPLWSALEGRLGSAPEVTELLHCRVGPSSGAHSGPGTISVSYYASGIDARSVAGGEAAVRRARHHG